MAGRFSNIKNKIQNLIKSVGSSNTSYYTNSAKEGVSKPVSSSVKTIKSAALKGISATRKSTQKQYDAYKKYKEETYPNTVTTPKTKLGFNLNRMYQYSNADRANDYVNKLNDVNERYNLYGGIYNFNKGDSLGLDKLKARYSYSPEYLYYTKQMQDPEKATTFAAYMAGTDIVDADGKAVPGSYNLVVEKMHKDYADLLPYAKAMRDVNSIFAGAFTSGLTQEEYEKWEEENTYVRRVYDYKLGIWVKKREFKPDAVPPPFTVDVNGKSPSDYGYNLENSWSFFVAFMNSQTSYNNYSATTAIEEMAHTAGSNPRAADSFLDVVRDALSGNKNVVSGLNDYLSNYIFNPLSKGNFKQLGINMLWNLGETMDYAAVAGRAALSTVDTIGDLNNNNVHLVEGQDQWWADSVSFVDQSKLIELGCLKYLNNEATIEAFADKLRNEGNGDLVEKWYAFAQDYKNEFEGSNHTSAKEVFDAIKKAYTDKEDGNYLFDTGSVLADTMLYMIDPTLLSSAILKTTGKEGARLAVKYAVEDGLRNTDAVKFADIVVGDNTVPGSVYNFMKEGFVDTFIKSMGTDVLTKNPRFIQDRLTNFMNQSRKAGLITEVPSDLVNTITKNISDYQSRFINGVYKTGTLVDALDRSVLKATLAGPYLSYKLPSVAYKKLRKNSAVSEKILSKWIEKNYKAEEIFGSKYGQRTIGNLSEYLENTKKVTVTDSEVDKETIDMVSKTILEDARKDALSIEQVIKNVRANLSVGKITPEQASDLFDDTIRNITNNQVTSISEFRAYLDGVFSKYANDFPGLLDNLKGVYESQLKEIDRILSVERSRIVEDLAKDVLNFTTEVGGIAVQARIVRLKELGYELIPGTEELFSKRFEQVLVSDVPIEPEKSLDALYYAQPSTKSYTDAVSLRESLGNYFYNTVNPLILEDLKGKFLDYVDGTEKLNKEDRAFDFEDLQNFHGVNNLRNYLDSVDVKDVDYYELSAYISDAQKDLVVHRVAHPDELGNLLDILNRFSDTLAFNIADDPVRIMKLQMDRMETFNELINNPKILSAFDRLLNPDTAIGKVFANLDSLSDEQMIDELISAFKQDNILDYSRDYETIAADFQDILTDFKLIKHDIDTVQEYSLFYRTITEDCGLTKDQAHIILDTIFGLYNYSVPEVITKNSAFIKQVSEKITYGLDSVFGESLALDTFRKDLLNWNHPMYEKYFSKIEDPAELQVYKDRIIKLCDDAHKSPLADVRVQMLQVIFRSDDAVEVYNRTATGGKPVIFYDIETTGLIPNRTKMTSIAFLEWEHLPEDADLDTILKSVENRGEEYIAPLLRDEILNSKNLDFLPNSYLEKLYRDVAPNASRKELLELYAEEFGVSDLTGELTEQDLLATFLKKADAENTPCFVAHNNNDFDRNVLKSRLFKNGMFRFENTNWDAICKESKNSFELLRRDFGSYVLDNKQLESVLEAFIRFCNNTNGASYRFNIFNNSNIINRLENIVRKTETLNNDIIEAQSRVRHDALTMDLLRNKGVFPFKKTQTIDYKSIEPEYFPDEWEELFPDEVSAAKAVTDANNYVAISDQITDSVIDVLEFYRTSDSDVVDFMSDAELAEYISSQVRVLDNFCNSLEGLFTLDLNIQNKFTQMFVHDTTNLISKIREVTSTVYENNTVSSVELDKLLFDVFPDDINVRGYIERYMYDSITYENEAKSLKIESGIPDGTIKYTNLEVSRLYAVPHYEKSPFDSISPETVNKYRELFDVPEVLKDSDVEELVRITAERYYYDSVFDLGIPNISNINSHISNARILLENNISERSFREQERAVRELRRLKKELSNDSLYDAMSTVEDELMDQGISIREFSSMFDNNTPVDGLIGEDLLGYLKKKGFSDLVHSTKKYLEIQDRLSELYKVTADFNTRVDKFNAQAINSTGIAVRDNYINSIFYGAAPKDFAELTDYEIDTIINYFTREQKIDYLKSLDNLGESFKKNLDNATDDYINRRVEMYPEGYYDYFIKHLNRLDDVSSSVVEVSYFNDTRQYLEVEAPMLHDTVKSNKQILGNLGVTDLLPTKFISAYKYLTYRGENLFRRACRFTGSAEQYDALIKEIDDFERRYRMFNAINDIAKNPHSVDIDVIDELIGDVNYYWDEFISNNSALVNYGSVLLHKDDILFKLGSGLFDLDSAAKAYFAQRHYLNVNSDKFQKMLSETSMERIRLYYLSSLLPEDQFYFSKVQKPRLKTFKDPSSGKDVRDVFTEDFNLAKYIFKQNDAAEAYSVGDEVKALKKDLAKQQDINTSATEWHGKESVIPDSNIPKLSQVPDFGKSFNMVYEGITDSSFEATLNDLRSGSREVQMKANAIKTFFEDPWFNSGTRFEDTAFGKLCKDVYGTDSVKYSNMRKVFENMSGSGAGASEVFNTSKLSKYFDIPKNSRITIKDATSLRDFYERVEYGVLNRLRKNELIEFDDDTLSELQDFVKYAKELSEPLSALEDYSYLKYLKTDLDTYELYAVSKVMYEDVFKWSDNMANKTSDVAFQEELARYRYSDTFEYWEPEANKFVLRNLPSVYYDETRRREGVIRGLLGRGVFEGKYVSPLSDKTKLLLDGSVDDVIFKPTVVEQATETYLGKTGRVGYEDVNNFRVQHAKVTQREHGLNTLLGELEGMKNTTKDMYVSDLNFRFRKVLETMIDDFTDDELQLALDYFSKVQNQRMEAATRQVLDYITQSEDNLISHLLFYRQHIIVPLKYSDDVESLLNIVKASKNDVFNYSVDTEYLYLGLNNNRRLNSALNNDGSRNLSFELSAEDKANGVTFKKYSVPKYDFVGFSPYKSWEDEMESIFASFKTQREALISESEKKIDAFLSEVKIHTIPELEAKIAKLQTELDDSIIKPNGAPIRTEGDPLTYLHYDIGDKDATAILNKLNELKYIKSLIDSEISSTKSELDDLIITTENTLSSMSKVSDASDDILRQIEDIHTTLNYYSGNAINGAIGTLQTPSRSRLVYNALPSEFKQNLYSRAFYEDPDNFNVFEYDMSILGDSASRFKHTDFNESDLFLTTQKVIDELSGRVQAENVYLHSLFNRDNPSNFSNLFDGFTDKEILAELKNNSEFVVVTAQASKETPSGVLVKDINMMDELSCEIARETNAIVVTYETFLDMVNTFNHAKAKNSSFLKIWSKCMLVMKVGHLANPGTWIRNWLDATIKASGDIGDVGNTARYQLTATKMLYEYKKILNVINTEKRSPYHSKKDVRTHWEAYSAASGTKLTYDEFVFLDEWMQNGLSGGESTSMKALRKKQEAYEGINIGLKPNNGDASPLFSRNLVEDLPVRFRDLGEAEVSKYIDSVNFRDYSITKERFMEIYNNPETILSTYEKNDFNAIALDIIKARALAIEPRVNKFSRTCSKVFNMALSPMSLVEEVVRLGEYLALQDKGYTRNKIFQTIAASQFNYDLKTMRARKLENIFLYYTFDKSNMIYWLNQLSENPMMLRTLELLWGGLSWDSAYDYVTDEEDPFNNASLAYTMLNGGIPIGDKGLYLKTSPSFLSALNYFYSGPEALLSSVAAPIEFLAKSAMTNIGIDYRTLFGTMSDEFMDESAWLKALGMIPVVGTVYDRTFAPRHVRNTWARALDTDFTNTESGTFRKLWDNMINGNLAPMANYLLPSVFGTTLLSNNADFDNFEAFQRSLALQNKWYDSNLGKVVDISQYNTIGLNNPNLTWDQLVQLKLAMTGKVWDNNKRAFIIPEDYEWGGLNRKFDWSNPSEFAEMCDLHYTKFGEVWDANQKKWVLPKDYIEGGLNEPNLSWDEKCYYMYQYFEVQWDNNQMKFVDKNHYIEGGLNGNIKFGDAGTEGYTSSASLDWSTLCAYKYALHGEVWDHDSGRWVKVADPVIDVSSAKLVSTGNARKLPEAKEIPFISTAYAVENLVSSSSERDLSKTLTTYDAKHNQQVFNWILSNYGSVGDSNYKNRYKNGWADGYHYKANTIYPDIKVGMYKPYRSRLNFKSNAYNMVYSYGDNSSTSAALAHGDRAYYQYYNNTKVSSDTTNYRTNWLVMRTQALIKREQSMLKYHFNIYDTTADKSMTAKNHLNRIKTIWYAR